jgi:hypothetical protein
MAVAKPGGHMLILAVLRRLWAATGLSPHRMEHLGAVPRPRQPLIDDPPEEVTEAEVVEDIADESDGSEGGWEDDLLSYRPLHDRGGGVSVYQGASGPIGILARIELNWRTKREDIGEGVPDDPFNESEFEQTKAEEA